MATINGVRVGLYVLLWLFSVVLLGLCATRLHYTISLPPYDPLDNGKPFYDPIVVELAVTSILALFWSSFLVYIIHGSDDHNHESTFAIEHLGLFCLFVPSLVGAVIATVYWGNLLSCHSYWQCRVLTALVTFAWMTEVLFFILLAGALYNITKSAIPPEKRFRRRPYVTVAPYEPPRELEPCVYNWRSHDSFGGLATLF